MDWFLYDNGPRHERVKYSGDKLARAFFIRYMQTLCYFMSSALHKIVVLPVYKPRKCSF